MSARDFLEMLYVWFVVGPVSFVYLLFGVVA